MSEQNQKPLTSLDIEKKEFWKSCVLACLRADTSASYATERADYALKEFSAQFK